MKRKILSITLCLAMVAAILGAFGIPALAKTPYSDGASSLVINKLNADGSIDWSYEYEGSWAGTHYVGEDEYDYYTYPSLEDDLEELEISATNCYATIDAFPAAVGTKGYGVTIDGLVDAVNTHKPAGETNISWTSNQKFVLYATDATGVPYQSSNFYTHDFVEDANRKYYPNLVERYTAYQNGGSLTGWDTGAESVTPMLCLCSYQERYATDAILDNSPTMDSKESLRFCMGLTPTEASNGIAGAYSSTNKFCRWVNRIDFGPINTPDLTPDTTNNIISTAIDITFTDDATWRSHITGVTVDNVSASPSITAGNIQFSSLARGARAIAVSATGYPVDCVTQNIYETSPTLTADTTDNNTTHQIDITFTDNSDWRTAFIGLTVDGDEVTSGYMISFGHIIFNAGVLVAGTHTVVVSADYYSNASVTQVIN